MQGRLAAMIALAAGCSFDGPRLIDAAFDPSALRCPGAYDREIDGHKYRLIQNALSWMQAKAACEQDGAALIKLDSSTEDGRTGLFFSNIAELWIGLHDADQDGAYLWTDGTAPTFTHWDTPPSAASPDCVVKRTSSGGRWSPLSCTEGRPSACECIP